MTGPGGDQPHGWWRVLEVGAPHRLEFEDGFADRDGTPNPDLPITSIVVRLVGLSDGRTRMSIEAAFPSAEAMDQMVAMGTEEGITLAVGQIDASLSAEVRS